LDYKNSVLASLAGGVVLGIIMSFIGGMEAVAGLVGGTSVLVGWIVHLVISVLLGLGFGYTLARRVTTGRMGALWAGLLYGFVWYILGPLTLMPLFLGQGIQWSGAAISGSYTSLIGHLVYGLVLGWTYQRLSGRSTTTGTPVSG